MAKKTTYHDWEGKTIPEEELPEQYILMADGTVVPGSLGHDGDVTLWAFIPASAGLSILQIITIFSDENKTKVLRSILYGKVVMEYKAYKTIRSIRQDSSGEISVGLRA